jgi:hypothetical protein
VLAAKHYAAVDDAPHAYIRVEPKRASVVTVAPPLDLPLFEAAP